MLACRYKRVEELPFTATASRINYRYLTLEQAAPCPCRGQYRCPEDIFKVTGVQFLITEHDEVLLFIRM
jgi:hypothetical protein